jgi:hypothetical protein
MPWHRSVDGGGQIRHSGRAELVPQGFRDNSHSATRDINLTNRADYAGLPSLPPPDPPFSGPTA